MIQELIYKKDINRPINGVIKADSKTELANEITEYVITAEQQQPKLLPALFRTLVPGGRSTCVWISGDFGSGKSHLLKILSYVLENELTIEGRKCAEIFAKKADADFELEGDIRRACTIPTESVLFNIQEKLDGVAKGSIDPVLNIFLKEFNRKMGFDDKKPEIAEIERYFDSKGKFDYLKQEFKSRFGEHWEDARKSILLKQQKLAEILADMEGISKEIAYQNIQTQIKNYKLDIDGFVGLVKTHLEKQQPESRFIFFVDEVGQFIGKDVHRMLSLQTIAEGLIDKTNGRASVIVTSQMDIDATLGDLEKQQKYDFSRIQGRFTTRISLTSANADEVIQRRLLEKKDEPQAQLCRVYENQKNIIKSLFNFSDSSQFKTNYKSADQFAIDFPFVDYQFDLLQRSIIELSKNNAFSGTQQSVGERSLLTITQEVAKAYKDKDLNQIVQFSDMYEGIRGILQTKIQSDIQQAERTLDDELAVSVLKVLFLIKYVKGFPSTTDNITKIMLPTLNTDFPEYKSRIQEALNKLVRTSYIEKGAGDEYHYQTNEEKDIETEIKNEDIAPDAINNELKKIFRDEIFPDSKIKLSANKIFSYGRMVDEQQDGRDVEMYIHFITPLNMSVSTAPQSMMMYSMGHSNQLCVVLGEDKYMSEDLAMFKKADKCLTRMLSGQGNEYRQQIVSDKRRVNAQRRTTITERLTELTKNARLYMAGQELIDIRSSELKTRLNDGMTRLVEIVYPNLKMLTIEYDDSMLRGIINYNDNGGFPWEKEMDNCMVEILNWINRNKSLSIRTKAKDLVEYFKGNGYGWYETATLCILAKLYKMDKVLFRSNGSIVADRDLYANMTNSNQQTVLIVDIEETITNSQIAMLKNLYKEFFDDESCSAQGAKDVHSAFVARLNKEITELRSVNDQWHFAFIKPVEKILPILTQLAGSVYPALYGNKAKMEEALDLKEEIDEVCQFVTGRQFEIFKRIDTLKKGNQANLSYVTAELIFTINAIYESKSPWKMMTQANETLQSISDEIKVKQDTARHEVEELINGKLQNLISLPAYATLEASQQSQINAMFESLKISIKDERYIGNLLAQKDNVNKAYNRCLESIPQWLEEKQNEEDELIRRKQETIGKGVEKALPPTPKKVIRKFVNLQKAMTVKFGKPMLETKEDVEDYINTLRSQLLEYIDKNNNIMLN